MADYPRVVSERVTDEWLAGCPVQIKKLRLTEEEPGVLALTVSSTPCGDFGVESFTVDLEYQSDRREVLGTDENVTLTTGDSAPVPVGYPKATRVNANIRSVRLSSGEVWENTTGESAKKLPDQPIFWQTDPLYETIRKECAGVVEARFQPDEIDGAWRCACGQVNLLSAKSCGACGCSREWLKTHLDRDYLEKRKAESDKKTDQKPEKKKKKKQSEGLSDLTKAILIVASILLLVVLAVVSVRVIVPSIRYNRAVGLADSGDYDRAAEIFADLGKFRDSAAQREDTIYRKAQELTGLEKVNMTTNEESPWFSIDENGMLSFRSDLYEKAGGTWAHFIVPDLVDGVIVRSLERNFFLNCKDLAVVTISDCVEEIGEQAFYNCESLHTVNFGKNVRIINQRTFINCTALEEITIPDTVEQIGPRLFNKCTALKKVVLGKQIDRIYEYMFSYCTSLEAVTLTAPVNFVGTEAFTECPAFRTIYCRFPDSEWVEPEVESGNEAWTSAEVVYQ